MIDIIIIIVNAVALISIYLIGKSWIKEFNKESVRKEEENRSLILERNKLYKDLDDASERKIELLERNANLTLSELEYKRLYLSTKEELSKFARDRDKETGRFISKEQQ